MTLRSGVLLAGFAAWLGVAGAPRAAAVQIALTSVNAFPNGRTTDDPPAYAIDGNMATFTWTTAPDNRTSPSYLAVDFKLTPVNRVRLWKTPNGGGGESFKNLVIEVTNESGPLETRNWKPVSCLENGFNGQELLRADHVALDGEVLGDRHDSPNGNGWASLTFQPFRATGLRIGFSSPGLVHYRVGEIQVHYDESASTRTSGRTLPAGQAVTIQDVQAFPKGRTFNGDLPPNAIDGNTGTYTWTTEAYNTTSPSYLAIAFARTGVNRVRLWKTPDGGGGESLKNLVVEYTTDTTHTLSARSWTRVSGLSNGFNGQEMLKADRVDADGSVTGDRHNSNDGSGWASLAFNPVQATGLRIGFASPGLVHYRVGEIQVLPAAAIDSTESADFGRPIVNGAVLTAAWIPDVTARKFCEIERQSKLVSFRISSVPIPQGTLVTRANLYSSDDWGKTFNGQLVPEQDRFFESIVCSDSTARVKNLDIDTHTRCACERPGVFIEVFPFTAGLEYREEAILATDKGGLRYRSTLLLRDLAPLRPQVPVLFYEEPAIPQIGFKDAQFAAEIAPQVAGLRDLLTAPKLAEVFVAAWNPQLHKLKQESFSVRCSFQGYANRNDVNIVLPLVCQRADGVAWDRREITLYVDRWHQLLPDKSYRIATGPALAAFLANPYTDHFVTARYRLEAVLRKDGVIPRSSIQQTPEDGPYLPRITWRDNFGIESIQMGGGQLGLAGTYDPNGTLMGTGFQAQGALLQSQVATVFKQADDVMFVVGVADKALTFYNKGGFVNYKAGLDAVAQSVFLNDPSAGWSVANFNPTAIVILVVMKVVQHNLDVAARNAFQKERDEIEGEVGDFADAMVHDIAMTKYYAEVYPYRKELFTLQFLAAASGIPLGERQGKPYACDSMMCQDFTSGRKLAVLPPVNKSGEVRNLWRIQENGAWREICRNTCPLQ